MDQVDILVYFIALSEYDQKCYEDQVTNRFDDSTSTLIDLIDGKYGNHTVEKYIIVFTKYDILKLKIQKFKNFKEFQKKFKGNSDDVESISNFIQNKYKKILKEKSKIFDSIVLNSLDIEDVKKFSQLLQTNLKKK